MEINQTLEKVAKITINKELRNVITFDMHKTKAILFSKAGEQKLIKQLMATKIKFDAQTIKFNKEST